MFGNIPYEFEEWESRLHPEHRERALTAVRDYLDGELPQYESEHRLPHKDGSYRWILARGAVVCDDSGKLSRIARSYLATTEWRSMEETLRIQLVQLISAQEPRASGTSPRITMTKCTAPRQGRQRTALGERRDVVHNHTQGI